jgi:hypothetical protein
LEDEVMEILDISLMVIVLGLAGYVWTLRRQITRLIPGETGPSGDGDRDRR